jgi:hypothetical protein
MIDAIIGFAATQCGKLDEFMPELFAAHCKDPTGGIVVHLMARAALARHSDAALRELCSKHGIAACRTLEETSRGRPLLVLDSTVAISPHFVSWSPDNRFLLFQDGGAVPRVLDTASGQLVDKALGRRAEAFAWSLDGKLAAVTSLRGLRLLAVGSWEEVGAGLPTNVGCRTVGQRHIAFTADSRSLWVSCSNHFSPQARVAQKLSVPELKVEDEVLLSPAPGADRTALRAVAIVRHADDVIMTGILYQYSETGELQRGGGITALSLKRKLLVYPPSAGGTFIRHTDDLSRVLVHTWHPAGAADKQGHPPPMAWAVETWDTALGKQIGSFGGKTDADHRRLLPIAVPRSNLLITAYSARNSARGTLVVMDDRSGAVLQEIGPMPSVVGFAVSSDGSRVAVWGFNETHIYKVNPEG